LPQRQALLTAVDDVAYVILRSAEAQKAARRQLLELKELPRSLFPLPHATLVHHDGRKPCLKAGLGPEAVDLPEDDQERILDDVLGHSLVPHDGGSQVEDTILEVVEQSRERIWVPFLALMHNPWKILHKLSASIGKAFRY